MEASGQINTIRTHEDRTARSSIGSENGRAISKIMAAGGRMRQAYERDLIDFRMQKERQGFEGPELPSLSDMQHWPGQQIAEYIAQRVNSLDDRA